MSTEFSHKIPLLSVVNFFLIVGFVLSQLSALFLSYFSYFKDLFGCSSRFVRQNSFLKELSRTRLEQNSHDLVGVLSGIGKTCQKLSEQLTSFHNPSKAVNYFLVKKHFKTKDNECCIEGK